MSKNHSLFIYPVPLFALFLALNAHSTTNYPNKIYDLSPIPGKYQTYAPPSSEFLYDTALKFQNTLKVQYELINSPYYDQLFEGRSSSSTINDFNANSRIFELRSYYHWKVPIEPGIAINYQDGVWNGDELTFKWSAIHIGPSIRFSLTKGPTTRLKSSIGVLKSVFYEGATGNHEYKFSSTTTQLDLEAVSFSRIGKLILGITYRHYLVSLQSTDSPAGRKDKSGMHSISLNAGFEFSLKFTNLKEGS